MTTNLATDDGQDSDPDVPTYQGRPDYYSIRAPPEKPLDEYDVHERRAAILRSIIDRGTPHGLNQRRTADTYDVSPRMIRKDLTALSEYIAEALGRDLSLTVQSLFERTVQDLRDDGEYKEAWNTAMEFSQWLADVGAIQYEPDRVQVEQFDGDAGPRYQVVESRDVTESDSGEDETAGESSEGETESGSETADDDPAAIPVGFTATPGSGASGDDAIQDIDGNTDAEGDS